MCDAVHTCLEKFNEQAFLDAGYSRASARSPTYGQWVDNVHQRGPPKIIVPDMDSSESPTYGEQEGSAYNGYFACTCYHPLCVFNQLGDVERCALRPGNVHSANGWRGATARDRPLPGIVKRLYFCGDAAFANLEIYVFLEAKPIGYRIRLPPDSMLHRRIGYLLKRPVGQPGHEVWRYYISFRYQAQSRNKPLRVVAKVEPHPGALCPRVSGENTRMSRDFFKRPSAGKQGVGGSIISDIQASLNAVSAFNIDVDGVFGSQTEQALSGFQNARGLPVTGTVSDTTWPDLMHSAEPPIFERCLQVVASFEGTQFTLIEGNFDGAGLTWGIIGFTLRNGEISSLLGTINHQFPDLLSQAFGHDAVVLMQNVGPDASPDKRMDFAQSVTGPRFRVSEPWRSGFATLGKQREVQRLQIERARDQYWTNIALRDANRLGLTEELDLLLMFDIAVQNGGMGSKGRFDLASRQLSAGMPALDRRRMIAQVVTDSITGQFKDDVRSRKMCIANGNGTVHGANYDLAAWGLAAGFAPKST